MHRRFLAGWRGVLLATAFASLIVASFPVTVAAPRPEATATAGNESGGFGTVIGEETNTLRLKTFPRTNYQWPFATGPHYGGQDLEVVPGMFRTQVGSFDLRGGMRGFDLPAELTATNRFADLGVQYYVLLLDPASFADGSFDGLKQSIEINGGAVLNPVPVAGFITRLTPASLAAVQASPAVLAAEPYHPAFKLNPWIGRAPLADPFKAVSDVYDLEVTVHDGEDAGATAARLAEMGGNVLSVFGTTVRVEIQRGLIAQIARLESVRTIGERLPIYPKAEETTNVMQTGFYCPLGPCGPIPYHQAGIDGGGTDDTPATAFRLHVLDTGFQLDNGDLSESRAAAGTAGATHRKVHAYESTNQFGGDGDLLGCDASAQGAFTHGHTAAATALGWATDVDGAYGAGWTALDQATGRLWKLDGVAPKARLVAFDAQVTPTLVSCGDPSADGIFPGDIYTAPSSGALARAYDTHGAKDHNFSWGNQNAPSYGTNASKIDAFLNDRRDAMVFVSAGNEGSDDDNDLLPDFNTVSNPATCKNCLSIGSTGNANDLGTGTPGANDQDARSFFSSKGPATTTYTTGTCPGSSACDLVAGGGRIAPILMAPGQERGNMGLASEFNCRSQDNDQNSPVECDVITGISGTSFSSPAAAGSALLVRDYFANGFYPSASARVADRVPSISGALLKAVLIASADWVGVGNNLGSNETLRYRANAEQGYGRIQLDNVLPLQTWTESPIGIVVADEQGFAANNTTLDGVSTQGTTDTTTFTVSDTTQELRIALAWTEGAGELVTNNLDLEVEAPDGTVYFGNYFTEDWNRNGALDAGEDCPGFDGATGKLDAFPWSLPTCVNSNADIDNVSEAVMLSPDPDANGDAEDGLSQIQAGDWTLRVKGTTVTGSQRYAVVIAGGVAITSSVRFTNGAPVCNDTIGITVNETDEVDDPGAGLTAGEIASRIVVEVLEPGNPTPVDSEPGSAFTFSRPDPAALRFVAEDVVLSEGTAPDPGNGVLDIVDGATLRVVYNDEANGSPDPDQQRISTSSVDCSAAIGFGDLVFGAFGRDTLTFVDGGCERSARDSFEFGFPDRYIDNGEQVGFGLAFFNDDGRTLTDAVAELRCVIPDGDSPEDCLPGSNDCADPNRLNNAACSGISILDSPKVLGDIPSGSAIAAIFTVEATAVAPNTEVEMVLGVSSPTSGKSVSGYAISRQVLEADEQVFYYSTDFVTGGTEFRDYNNSETLEVTESVTDFFADYRFEQRTWSDATATGRNGSLRSPWNFETNNGGFVSGIGATSTADLGAGNIVANWGEDKNFNAILDAGEDRDPADGILSQNWSTGGGCGWQTGVAGTSGGVWHTGGIRTPTSGGGKTCLYSAQNNGKCQNYEIINGTTGTKTWFEVLLTPVVEQVNDGYRLEHVNWAWNMNQEFQDQFVALTWELDTDTTTAEPIDLTADLSIFNAASGPAGPISGESNPGLFRPQLFGVASEGYSMFAPSNANGTDPGNGTVGNNRVGDWSCYFDSKGLQNAQLGPAGPPDDDLDNDGDGTVDEYVQQNGPIRNFDLTTFNGPDLRFTTMEDIYGPSGSTFQGALGFFVAEDNDGAVAPNPTPGYGAAIDDMVMEWKEINVIPDATDCASGQCATINLDVTNFYEGSAILNITLTEQSPDASNDCDLDGFPDGTRDCDADGADDVPVEVYNDLRQDTEIVFLNETGPGTGIYRGQISISAVADVDALAPWNAGNPSAYAPGSLFVQRNGTDLPSVNIDYKDNDDGTGNVCNNDIDPAGRGLVSAGTAVIYPAGRLSVKSVRLVDNGDGDGIADTNETVNMFVTLNNNSGVPLTNVVARISTNDDKIECITDSALNVGDIADGAIVESPEAFVFKVSPSANRPSAFGDYSAKVTVSLSAEEFAATFAPQVVTLDLDLNIAAGAGTPTTYLENFDSSGTTFGSFTSMTLDAAAKGNNNTSNGYRCQYNDPDFINANSYGNTDCYLEHLAFQPLIFDWHVHDQGDAINAPDGGRAYSGANSAHWGDHNGNPDDDTTSFGQLDAIRTTNPVHLSANPALAPSELSFKTQISIVDDRTVNAPGGESPDRVVAMVRLADNGGTGTGNWIKISPYANVYDRQGTDNFFECMFDPIDDGSTEDDFFDPADPDRRLGPSSTCYPEFAWAFIGDTDYRNTFNENAIGRASDGPGLQGSIDRGTWVEPKFDLARFKGRSIFVRFVVTTIQVAPGVLTIEQLFDLPSGWVGDDGVYIDDVTITNAVTSGNTTSIDNANNGGLIGADCAQNCTTLTAALETDRAGDATPAPGHVIELSAAGSSADTCIDGVLQYQFWIDNNANGVLGDAGDTLLRNFTDDPVYTAAPTASGQYGVKVRCSSAPDCGVAGGTNDAVVPVTVNCPASGNLGFSQTVGFNTKTQLGWATAATVDAVRGNLTTLRNTKTFTGTIQSCVLNDANTNTLDDATTPTAGNGLFWLVKGSAGSGGACNAVSTYSSGGAGEAPDRDAEIGADGNACP